MFSKGEEVISCILPVVCEVVLFIPHSINEVI